MPAEQRANRHTVLILTADQYELNRLQNDIEELLDAGWQFGSVAIAASDAYGDTLYATMVKKPAVSDAS